jgi:hypothetical protein
LRGDLDWGSVSTLSTTTSRCSASCPSGRCVLRYPGGGNGKQRDMARPRRAPPDQPSGGTTRALLFSPPQSSPLPPPSAAAAADAVLGSLLPGGRPRGPCAGGSHPRRRRRRRNRGGSGRAPRRSEGEGRIRPPPDRAGSESGFRCDLSPQRWFRFSFCVPLSAVSPLSCVCRVGFGWWSRVAEGRTEGGGRKETQERRPGAGIYSRSCWVGGPTWKRKPMVDMAHGGVVLL